MRCWFIPIRPGDPVHDDSNDAPLRHCFSRTENVCHGSVTRDSGRTTPAERPRAGLTPGPSDHLLA